MIPSTLVLPEDWLLPDHERMQQYADLARLFGGAALPLALLAQWAGAATTNAGRVHHPQVAVGFSTSLLGNRRTPAGHRCSLSAEQAQLFSRVYGLYTLSKMKKMEMCCSYSLTS